MTSIPTIASKLTKQEDEARWIAKRISPRVRAAILDIEGEVSGDFWMKRLRGVNSKYRLVSTRYDSDDAGHYSLTDLGISVRTRLEKEASK